MAKLKLIDSEQFILDGEFERFKAPSRSILDEDSVINAIEKYNKEMVLPGKAFGSLNEGFLLMATEMGEQIDEEEKIPAFMIIDIQWDAEKKVVFGKIILLDTDDGNKIKDALKIGLECYMSSSETNVHIILDKQSGKLLCRVSDIKGYKVSILNFHNTI